MIIQGSRTKTLSEGQTTEAELAPVTQPKLKPKTQVQSGGSKKQTTIGAGGGRDKDKLRKWKEIYENGGIESQVLENYALFITANGYRFEGENPSDVQKVRDFVNSLKDPTFDECLYHGVIDAGWAGSAFQELIAGRISNTNLEALKEQLGKVSEEEMKLAVQLAAIKGGDILGIRPIEAESVEIIYDDSGIITGYEQSITVGSEKRIKLKPEQVLHIRFFGVGGSIYGLSMYQRAYDEIMRDTKTAEASAEAIDRHGFKKYHIKVGQPGETVSESDINTLSTKFQDITTKNEFTTTADVDIKNIDEGGLDKVEDYNDISIMRMCAGLGIPEEIAGLRRGSTDATAVERIKIFLKRITAMQKRLAQIYNVNVFDRITGKPSAVKLVFNDVDASDEATNAKWMSQLMLASPLDPFAVLPVEYIQQRLGIVPKLEEGTKPKPIPKVPLKARIPTGE